MRKVLANGAWGYLDKLNEKVAKIRELQNDIDNIGNE